MAHDGFGPDLSFRNKEINPGSRSRGPGNWSGKKQSTYAEIADTSNVLDACRPPANPDAFRRLNPGGQPS